MKINKVLLGMFAGVLALMGGSAKAQFHEIGPANIGGHVSSLVFDQQDTTNMTVYAGAISGGLYVSSANPELLAKLYTDIADQEKVEKLTNDATMWHMVRYIDATGQEMTLNISAMNQIATGELILGTGDDFYTVGSSYKKMSMKGRGIYRFSSDSLKFTLIPYTDPAKSDRFVAVRAIESYAKNDTVYLYVATSTGLYRWTINTKGDGSDWNKNARLVQAGNIDQLLVVRQLNVAYFTIGNQLYRIGNLTAADNALNPVNISASNKAFGGVNSCIKLAVAPSKPTYLYAMVLDQNGILDNVYLTTNGQTWTGLATASVMPMYFYTTRNGDGGTDTVVFNSGRECGAIAVDPFNEKRIIIAGTNIWVGEGFLEGNTYTWTKSSYSEHELNYGDYMSQVFNTSVFVHSGIQKIVPAVRTVDGEAATTYHFATSGGYFSTVNFYSFNNLNRGMNNVQINSIAVTPDGSIISGANDNACPFIESRMAHNGGTSIAAWYDDGELGNMNHDANILWRGNGGKVAASAFQQINILPHRNIFVSAAGGRIGRSYTDYLDYTNNQTWTTGSSFLTSEVIGGPDKGFVHLWESANDKYYRDSIGVALDMRGYLVRSNGDTLRFTYKDVNDKDSIANRDYKIKAGDRATFLSKNNSDYPFEYTFTSRDAGKSVTDSFMVKSPVVSRLLIFADISSTQTSVLYSWTASDFSKIYDSIVENDRSISGTLKAELRKKYMWWAPLLTVGRNPYTKTTHLYPREAVISPDGLYAYISTYDDSLNRSQFYRVSGFENVNFMSTPIDIRRQLNAASDGDNRVLKTDKFYRGNNANRTEWFNRPISSIAVDPRSGVDRVVLTFDTYSESYANVAIINDATTDNWSVIQNGINGRVDLPAYCAMIEKNTGDIYVGTADGVYIFNGTSWRQYEHLRGVPVTSIIQQNNSLEVKRATTHTGINENNYLFAKTKWPGAIYFGTYGRGIFMDMTYVTDMENEISDPEDYNPVDIPTVEGNGESSISIFPNPVMGEANLSIVATEAGNAVVRIYDLNGRMVAERKLGHIAEGEQTYTISTDGMAKGMYLVNVIIGGHTSATKMVVR